MRQLQCLLCPKENIVCTRFVQRFLRFSRPQTAQNNSQKLRLKNHNLLYKYNPASEAILQKTQTTLKLSYDRDYGLFYVYFMMG